MPGIMSVPVKVTLIGASVGITLIGVLAMYFRRKKKRSKKYKSISDYDEVDTAVSVPTTRNKSSTSRNYRSLHSPSSSSSNQKFRHSNGDLTDRRSLSPSYNRMSRSGSQISLKSDAASTSTVLAANSRERIEMTAEQLCAVGIEALDKAIANWEEAVEKIEDSVDEDSLKPASFHLSEQLHLLLERGYRMRDHFEQRMFKNAQSNAALDAAIQEMDREYEERRKKAGSIGEASSDMESFVSALDLADLSDIDDQKETHQHLALYEAALLELEHGSIPCRALRTKWMNCEADTEFLAKLHCVRLAFQEMFKDETVSEWFADNGRSMLSSLLSKADRDPEDFKVAYDDMLEWVKQPENTPIMEEELRGRGVKLLTFFDVVIDFILFDAFEDLESPPSSVKSVVQNRWLSNGFKETALATACWSVLKAKRRLLKFKNGFISHFYVISEQTSPVLAWGFLGPDGELKELCEFFKDQVMGFMQDVFSFNKVRYTVVEQLADDILQLSRKRMAIAAERLGV